MYNQFFRKYIDIVTEAEEEQQPVVSQDELSKLWSPDKIKYFIKATPVALMPFTELSKKLGQEKASEISSLAGSVDATSYGDDYANRGYVIFQWDSKSGKPDIYIAPPDTVKSKYVPFQGQLPTDEKARSKIPSLVVLQHLTLDPNKFNFYLKKSPVPMISANQLGLENKTIQTSWGTQKVQSGGFIVREDNGHIYTVAPDSNGLPIGYIANR
jgi:hypothetical protein